MILARTAGVEWSGLNSEAPALYGHLLPPFVVVQPKNVLNEITQKLSIE